MIKDVSVLVRTDVSIEQPELPILDNPVCILQVHPSGANGFHFCPGQNDARLKFFQQEIVVGSDPIDGSIALSGGGRVAPGIFFLGWPSWANRLACHQRSDSCSTKSSSCYHSSNPRQDQSRML